MRKHVYFSILTLTAALLIGSATAQNRSSAEHRVSVTVPSVLRLSIGGTERADHDIEVRVEDGRATLTPGASTLRIFSNEPWKLLVSYTPDDPSAGVSLEADAGAGWTALGGSARTLLEGDATGGWQDTEVRYGLLAAPAADGVYRGVVTYTLTRP